ncbi:helveticin J family class III bacteriocin [Paenibacillus sp. GCM10023248]|uniref:helveticin J family class III bacteriocin n=1 Tax=Bacillales TaxID=1385 RepID=UPI002378D530|nr:MULTISPECIES: helveticin J family class III bacteriocin [Bacillales]MDD9269222.1 helveticin J family class III bacteriocin [Paenibacillus sp. MAHUQ-63]MDR6880557.1 general stress protein 26 [Bacillus sp. 3255]
MFRVQALSLMKWRLKLLFSVVLSILIGGMSVMPAFAATPQKTVNASATLAYNLKGLKHNVAVQKAYIASTYLYVTQRSGGTCYLSRLLINGTDANYVDEMTVTNAGHCQTLDMYTYNDINYFYFSSKADPDTTNYWSLQVARLQYAAGATYDYTDLHRFTYMNYANKTGTSLGETYRVDAGGNSTHTVFRVQTKNGDVTWSIYDTVALNQLLDANEQVRMDSAAAMSACVTNFTQSGTAIVRPNESFQGADLLGSTEIYTSGGAETETPQIAMMSNTGAFKTLVRITNVGTHEIEGVQTKNSNVYFTIVTDPVNKTNTQKIYYVPDSIFR